MSGTPVYEWIPRPRPRSCIVLPVRALLVVNPAAGQRTAAPGDLDRAVAVLRDAGFRLVRADTASDGPTSADLARRAIAEGYDACIVAGGDGTVAPAARALLGTDIVLGILPFGSFMNIAHGIGLPLAPIDAAAVIARRRPRQIDAGAVNEAIFFETAGVGLDAELFVAARHAERGRWRRAMRRVYRWLTHRTHQVTITIDGVSHTHRAMQLLVLNSPYYAWAIPLLPDVSMEDGMLEVAVFPRMGRLALLRSLHAVLRMRPLPERPVRYRGARIVLSSPDPLTVHADGVLAGRLPVEISCRAGALRVFGA